MGKIEEENKEIEEKVIKKEIDENNSSDEISASDWDIETDNDDMEIDNDDDTESKTISGIVIDGTGEEIRVDNVLNEDERFKFNGENKKKKDNERKIKEEKFNKKQRSENKKSAKRDLRKSNVLKLLNNVKIKEGTALFNILSTIGVYLDYLLNFFTVCMLITGILLSIKYILHGDWIMSLVSMLFTVILVFVIERITKE